MSPLQSPNARDGGFARRLPALFPPPALAVLGGLLGLAGCAYLLGDRAAVEAFRKAASSADSALVAGLMIGARVLGKGEVAVFLGLLAAVAGYRRTALQILVALAICAAIVWPLKVAVNRERPNGADCASFPSGDAASSTAAVAPVAACLPGAAPVAVLMAASVAAARVAVGAHHPSDVLAGMAAGLFSALLAMALTRRWSSRVDPVWIDRGAWAALGVWSYFVARGRSDDTARFAALYGPALVVAGISAGLFAPKAGTSAPGAGARLWRAAGPIACAALGLGVVWLFREFAASPENARAAWFPAAVLAAACAAAGVRGVRGRQVRRDGAAVAAGAALLLLMFSSSRLLPGDPASASARMRSSPADDPTAIPQKLGDWGTARTASWKACRGKGASGREGGGQGSR